jgi:hypothetical protein
MALSRTFRSCITLVGLCLAASQAFAAYVWLEKEASGGIKASYGELNGRRLPVAGLTGARAFADGRDLGLTMAGDTISIATPLSSRDLRFTARTVGDKGVQYYHARFGRSETKAGDDLELVPTEANGNAFKLYWKGNVVSASQVNVMTADGWTRVLKSEPDGSMKLPTSVPGLYVLSVETQTTGAVTIDGKQYDSVRRTATLSFTVDTNCK